MINQKWLLIFICSVMLFTMLASPSNALAGSTPCGGSVTVASGDTLQKIANRCSTSVNALKLANNITNVNSIKVGQVLVMPGALIKGNAGIDIYIVNHRDTLSQIARDFKTTLSNLLKLNPSITNPNLIFAGYRLNVPSLSTPPQPTPIPSPTTTPPPTTGQIYIVQKGDTMSKIAKRLGISLTALVKANPQVTNINRIYVGQKLNIPDGVSVYIVVKGDTLKKIADRFGTTWQALWKLNPDIKNPNLIFVGQIIKLR
jgi:peptidoglycan endopeptidase LytE